MLTTSSIDGARHPLHRSTAASLLAEAAAPGARLRAAVSGVTGSGKSALLDHLESQYRSAGVRVRRDLDSDAMGGRRAVLIDDAHTLAESALMRIRELLDERDVNVVVAYGPWPHPPALRRLVTALDQHHSPVVLGPLLREDIAADVSAVFDGVECADYVDALEELTGGMPWLVHHVLADAPRHGARMAPMISRAILGQLEREIGNRGLPLRDLLLALAVGFEPSGPLPLAHAMADAGGSAEAVIEEARAEGMLLPDGRLIPLVRQALLEATPVHRVRALQRELVDTLTAGGRSLDHVARGLARGGLKDQRIAGSLEAAADHALARNPALAASLYGEAISAGADGIELAARRSEAACATGDLDLAARIVDDLLARPDPPDLQRGADVAAAVWANRGMLARSAELYRWLGPSRTGSSAARAALSMIGTGDRAAAQTMTDAAPVGHSPTLVSVALTLLAQGVRDSLDAGTTGALPALIRSSDIMTASRACSPLPALPAAIAATVAVQSGDLELAESVLERALDGEQGGTGARAGLLLLRAWTAMQADRPDRARQDIARATAAGGALSPRDDVLLRALEVGLARRADNVPALVTAWHGARESIMHVSVDLFSLLPLCELVIAAARLKDSARLDSHVNDAWALLSRLGDPPLWAVPLHWSAIQAAILSEQPGLLAPHAAALVRASQHSRLAAVLATAGRAWMSVLGGSIDVTVVEAAARGLAPVGQTWEGSRLAGHAAARADERKDMAQLLACARDLRSTFAGASRAPRATTAAAAQPAETGAARDDSGLSARERQIARLVLDGKTYVEIGEAIFISPRTVEHHVARIRRRLGVDSRSELLARLHLALDA